MSCDPARSGVEDGKRNPPGRHGDPAAGRSAQIDPTRIVEGVIAGAIGVACGVGNFILAGLVTLIALVIVIVLGYFEREFVPDED